MLHNFSSLHSSSLEIARWWYFPWYVDTPCQAWQFLLQQWALHSYHNAFQDLCWYSCPWIAAKICMWTLKVQQEWCTSSYEYPAGLCCTVSTASYCYSRDCPGWKGMIRLYGGSSTTGGLKHYHPWMLSLFAESKDILSSLVITDVVSFTFNCMETLPFNQTNRIALEIANPVQPNVEGKTCSQGPPIIWRS